MWEDIFNVAPVPEVTEEELSSISKMADNLIALQENEAMMQEAILKTQEKIKQITTKYLPELMERAGMQSFTTSKGFKITVKDDYQAYISADRATTAFEWLRKNGHGSLIKNEVKLVFNKNEDAKAKEVLTSLREQGYSPTNKEAVHPQTLKSFVKEQMTKGMLPTDAQSLLGVYVGKQAKISTK